MTTFNLNPLTAILFNHRIVRPSLLLTLLNDLFYIWFKVSKTFLKISFTRNQFKPLHYLHILISAER